MTALFAEARAKSQRSTGTSCRPVPPPGSGTTPHARLQSQSWNTGEKQKNQKDKEAEGNSSSSQTHGRRGTDKTTEASSRAHPRALWAPREKPGPSTSPGLREWGCGRACGAEARPGVTGCDDTGGERGGRPCCGPAPAGPQGKHACDTVGETRTQTAYQTMPAHCCEPRYWSYTKTCMFLDTHD